MDLLRPALPLAAEVLNCRGIGQHAWKRPRSWPCKGYQNPRGREKNNERPSRPDTKTWQRQKPPKCKRRTNADQVSGPQTLRLNARAGVGAWATWPCPPHPPLDLFQLIQGLGRFHPWGDGCRPPKILAECIVPDQDPWECVSFHLLTPFRIKRSRAMQKHHGRWKGEHDAGRSLAGRSLAGRSLVEEELSS